MDYGTIFHFYLGKSLCRSETFDLRRRVFIHLLEWKRVGSNRSISPPPGKPFADDLRVEPNKCGPSLPSIVLRCGTLVAFGQKWSDSPRGALSRIEQKRNPVYRTKRAQFRSLLSGKPPHSLIVPGSPLAEIDARRERTGVRLEREHVCERRVQVRSAIPSLR
jgi:hypothetical protein